MTKLYLVAIAAFGAMALTEPAFAGPQEDQNLQVVRSYYEAYSTGNPEAVRPFLARDVVWRIPGHHPLAGEKRGQDEVIAFFRGLAKGRFKAEPIFFQAKDDLVVDIHRGWSNIGSAPEVDQVYALMFRLRDGKIVEAQNFLTDMHASDAFFWAHYALKPLPARRIDDP